MNIWCLRPTEQYGLGLVEEFLNDKNIKIDFLTTTSDFQKHIINKKISLYDTEVKNAKNLGINFEIDDVNDTFEVENYSNKTFQKYKNISLNLLSRNERFFGELSIEERERYIFKQYIYWSNKLKNATNLDLIIFFDIPHIYYEYIIIGIAKLFKIPIIILHHSTRNTFLFNEDLDPIKNLSNSLNFETFLCQLNVEKHKKEENKKNSSTILFNLIILIKLIFVSIPKSIIFKFGKKYEEISFFIKHNYYSIKNNSDLNEKYHTLKYIYKCIFHELEYKIISSKEIPKKYIYLPLVSNHESDLFPGCWPWSTDKVIEYLLQKIKKTDYKICIKEHPRQFKIRYHQNFNRHKNFYKNYSKNKKIVFMSLNTKHKDLIEKSNAVVCSSFSSSALEGLELNKKVIYFGPNILGGDNCVKLENFVAVNKDLSYNGKNEKIYYPYKQNLEIENFNFTSQNFDRVVDKQDLFKIKENIFEYYKIISK